MRDFAFRLPRQQIRSIQNKIRFSSGFSQSLFADAMDERVSIPMEPFWTVYFRKLLPPSLWSTARIALKRVLSSLSSDMHVFRNQQVKNLEKLLEFFAAETLFIGALSLIVFLVRFRLGVNP
ncbi:hypothetical protein P8452_66319 [Trifolium repens]|nr:hypothetical protein P8452_66319 [Trifolium repens]